MTATGMGRRAALGALASPAVNRAVRRLARVRGHRLVVVYHRVGPPAPAGAEVVPCVPAGVFRAQLRALAAVADLVGLEDVLAGGGGGSRPKVALTFDDDLPSHDEEALPVLRELGVRATFFLSGRVLHGLGPYWFQQLEALLGVHGEARTAELLGVTGSPPGGLAVACERDEALRGRVGRLAADVPDPGVLDRGGISRLAGAGMAVGFHTVDHGILPAMDDGALDDAATRGRDELAAAVGRPLRFFAYPHGKADPRSAAAVRRAGFQAAWTGMPEPVRRGADPYRLGRWEPGPLSPDELLARLAVRLHRAAPGARGARA